MAAGSPLPDSVLSAFGTLSPSASVAGAAQACGCVSPPNLFTAVPCDVQTLEVTVSTQEGKATASVVVPAAGGAAPSATLDVACCVRPKMNVGAGETEPDRKSLHLKRDPARISVSASYAANCGQAMHPGISIDPVGDEDAICETRRVAGTQAQVEAFRLRSAVETSKLLLKGGGLLSALSAIWAAVDDDAGSGAVEVRSDSCGIRLSGPCVGAASVLVRLHAEEEVSLTIQMPALCGVEVKRSGETRSETGERLVDEKGQRKQAVEAKYTFTKEVTQERDGAYTAEEYKGSSRAAALAEAPEKSSSGDGKWGAEQLKKRGYDAKFSHNGDDFGLEEMESFVNFWRGLWELDQTLQRLRAMWEAGPGVKVCVGWHGDWSLQLGQVSGKASWTRKLAASQVVCHREGSVSLVLARGSAKASCGIAVLIERLTVECVNIDYSLSITMEGSIAGSSTFAQDKTLPQDWSSRPKERTVDGELKLTLKATGKVALLGRVVGTELAAASGLKGHAVLDAGQAIGFQSGQVDWLPVVFTVTVWIGSTGEADYTYEQELFAGGTLYSYPAPAGT